MDKPKPMGMRTAQPELSGLLKKLDKKSEGADLGVGGVGDGYDQYTYI